MRRPVNASLVPERRALGSRRPGRRTGRIRCGDRTERDHPREERSPGRPQPRPSTGATWGEGSEVVGRDGPEEIEAATQRRLLGAFCCSGCAGRRGHPMSCRTRAVRCRTWTPCSTVSTPPSATRSPAAPRRWRSWPARARARRGCSPAASRGSRARQRIDPAPRPRAHLHPQGRRRAPGAAEPARRPASRSPRARSTPSPSPSSGGAPTSRAAPMPGPPRPQGPDPGAAAARTRARGRAARPPSWRRRSSGPRPGW